MSDETTGGVRCDRCGSTVLHGWAHYCSDVPLSRENTKTLSGVTTINGAVVSTPSDDVKPYTREELEADISSIYGIDSTRIGAWQRIEAAARAGLDDRERLDWLERTLIEGDTDTYGLYDQAAGCWFVGEPPIRVESLRAAIDAARSEGR